MMKTKFKFLLGSVISAAFVLASANFSLPFNKVSSTNGVYGGSFSAFAATEATNEVGVVEGMLSTSGDYLLLATPLTITDYTQYSAVGYEIVKDGTPVVDDGLQSTGYYTGITVNTSAGSTTWTIADVFADNDNLSAITGMIVAEIEYDAKSDYSIKPYAIKDENKVYGEAQEIVQTKSFTYEVEDAMLSFTGDTVNSPRFVTDTTVGASGDGYFKNPGFNPFVITMLIESDRDCEATLYMTAAAHKNTAMYFLMDTKEGGVIVDYTRWFSVNGEKLTQKSVKIPSNAEAANTTIWTEVECDVINLKKGRNVLVYANPGEKTMTNIDCFRLETKANLSKCEQSSYTLEAEATTIESTTTVNGGPKVKTVAGCGASGDTFVQNLGYNNFVMTMTVYSDIDCQATMYFTAARHRQTNMLFLWNNDQRILTVNGVQFTYKDIILTYDAAAANGYVWGEVEIGVINLKAGENVIVWSNPAAKTMTDLDCFRFVTVGALTF